MVYPFRVRQWIQAEIPTGCEAAELPSLAEELGGRRRALLTELLGAEEGARAAAEAGLYQLGDSLVQRLQLQGVSLGDEGELPCLSPARWRPTATATMPARIEGVLLEDTSARELITFIQKTGAPAPADARALAELARHYFFGRRLRVCVRA